MSFFMKIKGRMAICLVLTIIITGTFYWNSESYANTNYVDASSKNSSSQELVTPCGLPVGIYIKTKGLLVVDICEVTDEYGQSVSPAKDKLFKGDYILSVDGISLISKEQFINYVSHKTGTIKLEILRSGKTVYLELDTVTNSNGITVIGAWVKDDEQGIGTVTFVKEDQSFGALGHGISDVGLDSVLSLKNGNIYKANILDINKGAKGQPGELIGTINYSVSAKYGEITQNNNIGVYGNVNETFLEYMKDNGIFEKIPAGLRSEVKLGNAFIQTSVDGIVKRYAIVIENIDLEDAGNKGITFKVSDKELLEKTNGIVQGMSGSPIIQNGKLIGAVTHVFVNEPDRGYAVFIDKMLE